MLLGTIVFSLPCETSFTSHCPPVSIPSCHFFDIVSGLLHWDCEWLKVCGKQMSQWNAWRQQIWSSNTIVPSLVITKENIGAFVAWCVRFPCSKEGYWPYGFIDGTSMAFNAQTTMYSCRYQSSWYFWSTKHHEGPTVANPLCEKGVYPTVLFPLKK